MTINPLLNPFYSSYPSHDANEALTRSFRIPQRNTPSYIAVEFILPNDLAADLSHESDVVESHSPSSSLASMEESTVDDNIVLTEATIKKSPVFQRLFSSNS